MFRLIFVSTICFVRCFGFAQEWETNTTDDGYEISFLRDTENNYLYVNVETSVSNSVSELVQIINDVSKYAQWIPDCISSKKIESYGKDSMYYYNQIDPPFPLSKHDGIFLACFDYKPDGSVSVYNKSKPSKLPPNKKFERVGFYEVTWFFKKTEHDTNVKYVLKMVLPSIATDFLISQFVKKGPEKSVRAFLDQLEK